RTLLQIPLVWLTMGFCGFLFLLFLATRWLRQDLKIILPSAASFAVFFSELFLGLSFLPFSPMVGGAFLATLWYFAAGILRLAELGLSLRPTVYRYAALSGLWLLVLSLTARWV
ncbi:hypothetical protein HY628_00145, partial [Candidatus Uhrbacteria bacterium]|nr:hypothetical protein [Candidatus Uhrbacteria bacterium]